MICCNDSGCYSLWHDILSSWVTEEKWTALAEQDTVHHLQVLPNMVLIWPDNIPVERTRATWRHPGSLPVSQASVKGSKGIMWLCNMSFKTRLGGVPGYSFWVKGNPRKRDTVCVRSPPLSDTLGAILCYSECGGRTSSGPTSIPRSPFTGSPFPSPCWVEMVCAQYQGPSQEGSDEPGKRVAVRDSWLGSSKQAHALQLTICPRDTERCWTWTRLHVRFN